MTGSGSWLLRVGLTVVCLLGTYPSPATGQRVDPGAEAEWSEILDEQANAPSAADSASDEFMVALAELCGRAFRGRAELVSGPGFEGEMIMHVRHCTEDEIQIPLHVGEDRSRTWIITRTNDGLRLKHDHRLEDGSDDPITQYGGDSRPGGTATEQHFPADAYTATLIPEAATNVWTITLTNTELRYHLSRDDEPRATFVFDLTDEVEPPPAPWGYEDR